MAGRPTGSAFPALSTGSVAQCPAPGTGSAHCLPESPPHIRPGIPIPSRITAGHRKGCHRHPSFRKPVLLPQPSRISGRGAAPRYKSLPPFSSGFAESLLRHASRTRAPCLFPRDGRHMPSADAPPARPLRPPALYWQSVRAVCGRSLPLPTREVFYGRPAMYPHPPFLPFL